jgi:hypothetical protein
MIYLSVLCLPEGQTDLLLKLLSHVFWGVAWKGGLKGGAGWALEQFEIYTGPRLGSAAVPWLSNPLLPEPKGWGEYYIKEIMKNKRTEALSPLIRCMALAISQTTRLVHPFLRHNKWRNVGNITLHQ